MVGGTVIENRLISNGSCQTLRRIWCIDQRSLSDECAVHADPIEAADIRVGDHIWWQGGRIYWTRDGEFADREIRKIGFSYDPNGKD